MPVFIPSLHQEKDGGCLPDRKYIEGSLSCNISERYFQQTVKREKLE